MTREEAHRLVVANATHNQNEVIFTPEISPGDFGYIHLWDIESKTGACKREMTHPWIRIREPTEHDNWPHWARPYIGLAPAPMPEPEFDLSDIEKAETLIESLDR